jgi:hypothetical protein
MFENLPISLKSDHRVCSVTLPYERRVMKRQLGYGLNEIENLRNYSCIAL